MAKNPIKISGNMIVKNEDQWVWHAIMSILPFIDELLITDTGSTDNTRKILKNLKSSKLKIEYKMLATPEAITEERNKQLKSSQHDWIWIIDGDEIYLEDTVRECKTAIESNRYEGIIVRRYDLLGDIYHRQRESVGSYELFGHTGHMVTRLINRAKIKGLHYEGTYPNEGWFDKGGNSTHSRNKHDWYITNNYLYHAMYLKRSSLGGNLAMINRHKYKIESGLAVITSYPEVFSLKKPSYVPDPRQKRSVVYEALANILTPIKELKRRLV